MKNNQLLPFERNRYFAGKMLTSSDFTAEQTYLNNKRRFINSTMFGSGVICGLSVFSLDDLSVLVESGVAVDDYGREIVVETSLVKKLSAIKGFEDTKTNDVNLCIMYNEEPANSAYSVNHREQGEEYEYSRIIEGYELFLVDAASGDDTFAMEDEFLVKEVLFRNEDFSIEAEMPVGVCRSSFTKIRVTVKKLSSQTKRLTYRSVLQMPVFTTQDKSHEIEISFENISLLQGQSVKKEYWAKAQDTLAAGVEIVVKTGSTHINIEGVDIAADSVAPMKISIVDYEPEELVAREVGKLSLEMRNVESKKDYICLACLHLVKTESAYLIDSVSEEHIKKYIAAPAYEAKKSEYRSFFAEEGITAQSSGTQEHTETKWNTGEQRQPLFATGTLEIPIGKKNRRGDICYSGEIMHGLGRGNVYVEIGYEYLTEDKALGTNAKNTIYGSSKLFPQDDVKKPEVETAVKVMNDKGSFLVAAKMEKEVNYLALTYRWVAIKFPGNENLGFEDEFKSRSITAVTPTVVLGTKDSYFFDVEFHNMNKSSLSYELTEGGSGEITTEGVYTAPAKDGVYEIRIFCTDFPAISTYAYAIVKKKGAEEDIEQSK